MRVYSTCVCLVFGLLSFLAVSGCTSRSKARAQVQAAFAAGQQQALSGQTNAPTVSFRGDVKNPKVPWTEEMTLAKALVAAEYTGSWDPHTIVILRQGEKYKVDPKRLLGGLEDPLLEPGDTVEIHR